MSKQKVALVSYKLSNEPRQLVTHSNTLDLFWNIEPRTYHWVFTTGSTLLKLDNTLQYFHSISTNWWISHSLQTPLEFIRYLHKDQSFDIIQHSRAEWVLQVKWSLVTPLAHFAQSFDHAPFFFLLFESTLLVFKSFPKYSIYSQVHPLLAIQLKNVKFDLTWVWPTVTVYLPTLFSYQRLHRSFESSSIT